MNIKRGGKINFNSFIKIREIFIKKLGRKLNIWILILIVLIPALSFFSLAFFETLDNMDSAASWTTSDPIFLAKSQETTIKTEGTGSLKIVAAGNKNDVYHFLRTESAGTKTISTKYANIALEMLVFGSSQTISSNTNWGSSTADSRMLGVRVEGDLTINSGNTLRATTRKRGMVIFVDGDLTVNGVISMTARGANAAGQRVLLVDDGTEYEIPAVGASGGSSVSSTTGQGPNHGNSGSSGSSGSPGGGGSGGAYMHPGEEAQPVTATATSGAGGSATSYSGGAGGGGNCQQDHTTTAGSGSSSGGAGGNAHAGYRRSGGGGAGNNGGIGRTTLNWQPGQPYGPYYGDDGAGGLLVLIVSGNVQIGSNGKLESRGSDGGYAGLYGDGPVLSGAGGGGSGGGGINVFHGGSYSNSGTIDVTRGTRGTGENGANGGHGGHGSSRIQSVDFNSMSSSLNEYVSRDFGAGNEIDLSYAYEIKFDIRSSRTGTYLEFGFGESAWDDNTYSITINSANTWETKTIDISSIAGSAKDSVRYLGFRVINADSGFTMYIDNITYIMPGATDGSPCIEDSDCLSGYCDNDGVGLPDDYWCFTPYNTYFDGQKPDTCEYSTGAITTIYSDERKVGDEIGMCTEIGESYFINIVNSTCELEDNTSVCRSSAYEPDCTATAFCNGVVPGTTIFSCTNYGQSYYSDMCTDSCLGGQDTSVCRSSAYAAGCTADTNCNNVAPNTCSGLLGYCNVCAFEAPDSSRDACDCSVGLACDGKTCYNTTWHFEAGTGHCCGNDANEYFISSDYDNSIEGSISDTEACCYYENSCVHEGLCYQHGSESEIDVNLDGYFDFCELGTWYDCNSTIGCPEDYSCIANYCIYEGIKIRNLGQTGFEQISKEHTSSRFVVLLLGYDSNKANKCRYSNDNITWSPWETCKPFKFWVLSDGTGLKTVYYNINKTDETKVILYDTIYYDPLGRYLDVTAPNPATVVDEGDYTNSASSLYAYWYGANDPELFFIGVPLEYEYRIYDNTSSTYLKDWTSTGTNTYVNATGLILEHNHMYTFVVRVSNSANLTAISMSDGIIVDLVSPNITLESSHTQNEWSSNPTIHFNWSVTEETLSGFSYVFDNKEGTIPDNILEMDGGKREHTEIAISDGIYYFHIKARDLAGNIGKTEHYGFIGIDTKPPERPIVEVPHRFASTESLTFKWRAYDAGSGVVNVSLNVTEVNGSTIFFRWLGNVTSYEITNATINKSYFAVVTARDRVGLEKESVSYSEIKAPQILFYKPRGVIRNNPIIVLKTDKKAVCRIANFDFEYTNSTYHETRVSNLADGEHQITVRCTDNFGYTTIKDISFNLIRGQTASSLNLNIPDELFVYNRINIKINAGIGEIRKSDFDVYINNQRLGDYSIFDEGDGNYSLIFQINEAGNYLINVSADGLMDSSTLDIKNIVFIAEYSETTLAKNRSRLVYGNIDHYSMGIASESKKPNVMESEMLKLGSELDGKTYIFITQTDRYLNEKIRLLELKEFEEKTQAFGYRTDEINQYRIIINKDNILVTDFDEKVKGRVNIILRNLGLNQNNQTIISLGLKR